MPISKEKRREINKEKYNVIVLQNEVWKDVVGYEGFYKVSNLGRIKSEDRIFYNKNKIEFVRFGRLKKLCETSKRNDRQGYLCTRLKDINNKSKSEYVHIIVAKAFIPNPFNKKTVNHIDGNKHNNNVNNLEWSSYSENNKHAINTGLRKKYIGFLNGFNSTHK